MSPLPKVHSVTVEAHYLWLGLPFPYFAGKGVHRDHEVRGSWGQGQSRSGQEWHTSWPLKASRDFIVHLSFSVGLG